MFPEPSSLFRRYTFRCDGEFHSTAFYHAPALTPEAQTLHLEMQFTIWLELTFPGARAAGRISHIGFTDEAHPHPEFSREIQPTQIVPEPANGGVEGATPPVPGFQDPTSGP